MPERHAFVVLTLPHSSLFLLRPFVDLLQISVDVLAVDGVIELRGGHSTLLDWMFLVVPGSVDVVVLEFGDICDELALPVFVFFYDGLDGKVFNC